MWVDQGSVFVFVCGSNVQRGSVYLHHAGVMKAKPNAPWASVQKEIGQ